MINFPKFKDMRKPKIYLQIFDLYYFEAVFTATLTKGVSMFLLFYLAYSYSGGKNVTVYFD